MQERKTIFFPKALNRSRSGVMSLTHYFVPKLFQSSFSTASYEIENVSWGLWQNSRTFGDSNECMMLHHILATIITHFYSVQHIYLLKCIYRAHKKVSLAICVILALQDIFDGLFPVEISGLTLLLPKPKSWQYFNKSTSIFRTPCIFLRIVFGIFLQCDITTATFQQQHIY